MRVRTFGHGTASQEEIAALLGDAGVERVVDVRVAPGSRRHPHVSRPELARWLPEHDIGYRWDKRLGGFRKPPPGSPDTFWQQEAFRGYAAHMRGADFLAAVAELLREPRDQVVMCSESLWWRCHRRLIADFLVLTSDVTVEHLSHDGRLVRHQPTQGVRLRDDGLLVYDGGQEPFM